VVAESAQSLKHFREDQDLRNTAEDLYVAMLRMVEACINSLVHESPCKSGQSNPNRLLTMFSDKAQVRVRWGTSSFHEKAAPGDCG
jgi:hypothetical protein